MQNSVNFCPLGSEIETVGISQYESVLETNNSAQFLRSKKENSGVVTYLTALCPFFFLNNLKSGFLWE